MRRIWIISGLTLIWAVVLGLNVAPVLRGGYGWRWPYELPESIANTFPLILMLFVVIIGNIVILQRPTQWLLLWAMGLTVGLTFAAVYVRDSDVYIEMVRRTSNGGQTGWHYAATDIDDLEETLENWPEFMASYENFSSHMETSPPGLPLMYYGSQQIFEEFDAVSDRIAPPLRADQCYNDRIVGWSIFPGYTNAELANTWLGLFTPFLASLSIIPLYILGQQFYDEKTARWAVLWWPLVPSVLMFSPYPTPFYAGLTSLMLVLLHYGLHKGRAIPLVTAGLVISIGTFMQFTLLPAIFLAGVYTLGYHIFIRPDHDRFWSIRVGLWFGIGLSSIWFIFWLISGVTPYEIFDQAINTHFGLDRPYFPWLFLHINDIFMFTGWPLILLAISGLWNRAFLQKPKTPHQLLAVSAVLTLLVMDISATTRGESGRIWLFIAPFFILIAANTLQKLKSPEIAGTILTITQAVALFMIVSTLAVFNSGLDDPPIHAPEVSRPSTDIIGSHVVFDNTIRLQNFTGHIAEDTLYLWITWQSLGYVDTPYYLSFLPVNNNEMTSTSVIEQPFNADFPTTCWLPESNDITTYHEIRLDDFEELGEEWWVSVALISREGVPAPARLVDGTMDNQVGIGPFRVMD